MKHYLDKFSRAYARIIAEATEADDKITVPYQLSMCGLGECADEMTDAELKKQEEALENGEITEEEFEKWEHDKIADLTSEYLADFGIDLNINWDGNCYGEPGGGFNQECTLTGTKEDLKRFIKEDQGFTNESDAKIAETLEGWGGWYKETIALFK